MDAQTDVRRPHRLAVIDALPRNMQDDALVDWKTVAAVLGKDDVEHTREIVTQAGVPLVQITSHRAMPRWAALRAWILSLEQRTA